MTFILEFSKFNCHFVTKVFVIEFWKPAFCVSSLNSRSLMNFDITCDKTNDNAFSMMLNILIMQCINRSGRAMFRTNPTNLQA